MRSTVRAGHVVVWLLAAISGNVPVATPAESTSATQRPGAPNETPIATSDAFPERGTAHPGAGELTMVDHVNRMAVLRPDRTDAQNKYHQDLPHHVALLPYAELFSCGARANLEDIPLGTHLFGWFHLGPRGWFAVRLASTDYEATVKNEPNERSPDAPYCRAIRLEDDFSFDARRDVVWEIVSIDRENRKVVARLTAATSAEHLETPASLAASDYEAPLCLEGEQTFDFDSATRVWKGQGLFTVEDLAPGLRVLLNRTWATLYGPGRLTDVWVDVESRRRAIERQARRFIEHERFRGVPARIESIEYGENASGVVTVTLYAAVSAVAREAVVPKSRGAVIVVEP
ncbi:MAG: hypothetical protein RLZZ440_1303, partial [Planctomycetota bacterium]